MTLVEEYYELNENDKVPIMWKIIHIMFYATAAFLGLWSGYTMALLRIRFGDKCYLYTKVKQSDIEIVKNSNANWEDNSWCDFGQYSMVSSFIVALIWAAFFLMCGKGGKSTTGLPQPWRIVWASFSFNLIYFVIALTAAINIQKGTDYFCSRKDNYKHTHLKVMTERCPALKALLKKDLRIPTTLQLEIVVKASWGCAACWFILFFVSLFRIILVVDFNMYRVCVFKIDKSARNKEEQVLEITNYEDFRKAEKRDALPASKSGRNNPENTESKPYHVEILPKEGMKTDKKKTVEHRPYFDPGSPLLQQNDVLYLGTDIRMLSRGHKRRRLSSSMYHISEKTVGFFDEMRSKPRYLRTHFQMEESGIPETSEVRDQLDGPNEFHEDNPAETSFSNFSATSVGNFYENWLQTDSGNDIFVPRYKKQDSKQFKKFK